jgi:hypothetical protein
MYNPLQITEAVSAALDLRWHIATSSHEKDRSFSPPFELLPWWRGFRGEIDTRAGDDGYVTHGIASIEDSELNEGSGVTIRIRELPIGRWTEDYKVFLQGLVNDNLLKSFREYHTESSVDFVLQLAPEAIDKLALNGGAWASPRIQDSLRRFFKLSSPLSTRNMHLFDVYGKIRRYTSPWGIIQDFMLPRGAAYAARRIKLEGSYCEQLLRAQARARFLSDVVSGRLVVNRRPRADIEAELWNRGFPTSSSFGGGKDIDESSTTSNVNFNTTTGTITPVVPNSLSHLLDTTLLSRYSAASKLSLKVTDAPRTQQQQSPSSSSPSSPSSSLPKSAFDYLLNLPLSQLSLESLQRTNKLAQDTEIALAIVRSTSPEAMWKNDLLALSTALKD